MKLTPPGTGPAPEKGLFNDAEQKRVRWMAIAFAVVLVSFVVSLRKENARREAIAEQSAQIVDEPVDSVLVLPEFDIDGLRSGALDATPEQRVLIEPGPLATSLRDSLVIQDRVFSAMDGRVLDAAGARELSANSDASRGQLLRVYGTLQDFERVDSRGEVPAHFRGRIALENGGQAHFAVVQAAENASSSGDFVRIDGLFHKNFRGEGESLGEWIDAPLIVGPRSIRAYPQLDPVAQLDPLSFLDVSDDSMENGITGQPFYAYWEMVSYVRDLDPASIDWQAAPALDREALSRLSVDGAAFRGQAMRLPLSQMMAVWELTQKENPLRIERMSEGWIGNEQWVGSANGLIHFSSPFTDIEAQRGDQIEARGFFLKNLAYEPRDGGFAIAPFFVLHSIEINSVVENPIWKRLLTGFGALIVAMVAAIYFLLQRDKRRSSELQSELRERRRGRREQKSKAGTPS